MLIDSKMKLKIKVKVFPGCDVIRLTDNGDCIDLRAAEDIKLEAPYANALHKSKQERRRYVEFDRAIIPLGVAMELPKGMVADVKPRSSINFAQDKHGNKGKFQMLLSNSPGFIDQTYCGPNDQWMMSIMAVGNVDIKKGDRICQFEIRPSMKATAWQKLRWLLSSGVELEFVDELDNPDRGGQGSTGVR
jgi:dUTP pyrophosphatase